MDSLTPAQKKVLDEFTLRAEKGQREPTLRELCDKFEWASPNAARTHVLALIKKGKPGLGVDVNSADELVDLKKAGIVDPARVTREAIQNAVSIAGTAITMGALVVEIPEKAAPAMPGAGGMGMDY